MGEGDYFSRAFYVDPKKKKKKEGEQGAGEAADSAMAAVSPAAPMYRPKPTGQAPIWVPVQNPGGAIPQTPVTPMARPTPGNIPQPAMQSGMQAGAPMIPLTMGGAQQVSPYSSSAIDDIRLRALQRLLQG